MSEVNDTTQVAPSEQPENGTSHRPHEQTVEGTRLAADIFGFDIPKEDPPASKPENKTTPAEETPKETPKDVKTDTPAVSEWYKNYGWDSEDTAKTEIEQLKTLKEKPPTPEEIKFENEQSKQIHELIRQGKTKEVKEFLVMQDKLDSYTNGDVSKESAEEIIKLGLQLKHKDLTQAEINYKFNKQYGIPSEPVQGADELDEDFSNRKAQWQATVNDIEMNKVIDAKLMRPELEQQKAKLVLPDIESTQQQKQVELTPEQVEANKKFDEAYISSVEQSVKDFSGFSLKVKNEDVGLPEISVSYSVADTEKGSLSNELKDWVNKSYDANALFTQRWVNKDGTVNTKQMAEDRYLLANRDAIFQKLAEETSKKSIEAYVRGKKNITIKDGTPDTTSLQGDDKTEMDKIRDMVFA